MTEGYVVFDLETTGFNPMVNEIIEIGAYKFTKEGVSLDKFEAFVKPERSIPTHITQLTGISNDMVAEAEDIQQVLPEFFDFCGDYPLVGYNLPFDMNFLVAKGITLGLDFTQNGNRLGLDVLQVVRKAYPYISHKLEDMVKYFNLSITVPMHRASVDAYMTKLVLDRCVGYTFTKIVDKKFSKAKEEEVGLPLF